MKALILAAGRGSRLRELTDDRPKCLVSLAGKPLLRWQYDALCAAGAKEVLVVRGYLAERLVPEAAGLPSGAFATVDNPRWAHCNMLASLLCAAPWLDAAFGGGETEVVVSYADIVYPAEHVRALCAGAAAIPYPSPTIRGGKPSGASALPILCPMPRASPVGTACCATSAASPAAWTISTASTWASCG